MPRTPRQSATATVRRLYLLGGSQANWLEEDDRSSLRSHLPSSLSRYCGTALPACACSGAARLGRPPRRCRTGVDCSGYNEAGSAKPQDVAGPRSGSATCGIAGCRKTDRQSVRPTAPSSARLSSRRPGARVEARLQHVLTCGTGACGALLKMAYPNLMRNLRLSCSRASAT